MIRRTLIAALLSLCLAGCTHRKPHVKVPTWIPCGAETEFVKDDGHREVWIFPCWPEKNEPKCIKGCKA